MQLELEHDASQLAVMRRSVRNFIPKRLDEESINACMAPLGEDTALFGAGTRYTAVHVEQTPVKLGTYGMIHGAKTFLAAVVAKKDQRAGFLQVGYQLEQSVLLAADKGLGTCWLGGTFDKTAFWQAAGVRQDEQLVIILPIGHPVGNMHLLEHIVRGVAGSARRKPFEKLFFQADGGTPFSETAAGAFAVPLSCVRLAPSAVNKQPWRVFLSQSSACFYLDRGKDAPSSSDIRYVDMGIALCHFELGAMQAGLFGKWKFDAPELTVPASYEFIAAWELNDPEKSKGAVQK